MKTDLNRIWVLALTLALPAAVAAEPVPNTFILRAAAAERVPAVVQSHGLSVVEQLDAAAPEVVMVVSSGTTPDEQVVEQVLEEEDVVGFERLQLAAITESAAGADLDQSYTVIVEALSTTGEHQGDLAAGFSAPLWEGYASQPLIQQVNLHAAHAYKEANKEDATPYGYGVVAVIDTGVDPDHPLLAGALVPGYDFVLDQPGIPSDWSNLDPASAAATRQDLEAVADQSYTVIVEGGGDAVFVSPSTGAVIDQSYTVIVENQPLTPAFGHGTMVAGIIRLVAPGAQIMPIRVFDGQGSADVFEIARAIRWAVDNGANVINMSFSTEQMTVELMRAVNYAYRNGVVCVASVGNRGERTATFPASYGLALGVAASTATDSVSSFSNRGSDLVALAAPGEGVITTYPGGGYAASWGTSFSTALVSGTVALLHQVEHKGNQPVVFKPTDQHRASWALEEGAVDPLGSEEWGGGRLDILETVQHRVPAGKMGG